MKTEKTGFGNIKDVLSRDEMKSVRGGYIQTWDCTCAGGTIGFNGWGTNSDFRYDVISAGCSNSPTYCTFGSVE